MNPYYSTSFIVGAGALVAGTLFCSAAAPSPLRIATGGWLFLETIFFGVQRLRYRKFNRRNMKVPSNKDVEQRFKDFLTLSPVLDINEFLSGWFLNVNMGKIRKGNVSQFLAYSLWFQPLAELTEEDQERVARFTDEVAKAWGITFQDGIDEELTLMHHLWEPLRVIHKPLVLHIAAEMSIIFTHLVLQAMKFERYECMGFTYWGAGLTKPCNSDEANSGSDRLTLFQSMFVDLHSLLNGDSDASRHGPLDFISAQAQGYADYHRRLQATLADIMHPAAFKDLSPPAPESSPSSLLPDISATIAALSEAIPTVSIPRLPSMPSMPLLNSFSMPLATDPASPPPDPTPTLSGIPSLPNIASLVETSIDQLTARAASAHAALASALPVLNLPDWQLPDWGLWDATTPSPSLAEGSSLTWRERLGAAITHIVEAAELDKLFAVLQDPVAMGIIPGSPLRNHEDLPFQDAESHSEQRQPHQRPIQGGLMQAWGRCALRARGTYGIGRFAGFSLPLTPSQLLQPLRSPFSFLSLLPRPNQLASVDPSIAAALRRTVEGSILQLSATSLPSTTQATPAASAHTLPPQPHLGTSVDHLPPPDLPLPTSPTRSQWQLPAPPSGTVSPKASPLDGIQSMHLESARRPSDSDIGAGAPHSSDSTPAPPLSDVTAPFKPATTSAFEDLGTSSAPSFGASSAPTPHPPLTIPSSRHQSTVSGGYISCHRISASSLDASMSDTSTGSASLYSEAQSTPTADAARVQSSPVTAPLCSPSGTPDPPVPCGSAPATAEPTPETLKPLVFLHGVGFGVLPYLGWVWKLRRAFPGRPFVLLEVRHVSLRLCMHAAGVDDIVRVLKAVLQRHHISSANFVGHSFGTFVVAHMRKLFPEAVSSALLCDPVCMLTCFPKLLYNFIYRGVSFRDLVDDPVEMARWLVARDLTIAATFCRHFFWHTLMLWPWELPEPSVLVLSSRDALVPSALVKKQLQAGLKGRRAQKVKVLEKDMAHGYFLLRPKWQDVIIETYRAAVEEEEEGVHGTTPQPPNGKSKVKRRKKSGRMDRNRFTGKNR